MLEALGRELSQLRHEKSLSLEAVAAPAKISAAYLHKLERGTVNNPSPRVLARVAESLGIEYFRLMALAGYLDEMQLAEARKRSPKPHPLSKQQLTPGEWKKVGAFIDELVAQRKRR